MKRIIALFCLIVFVSILLMGCSDPLGTPSQSTEQPKVNQNGEAYELSFIAEFYDNNGEKWLTTQGSNFNISPNKVKEYSWNSEGSWISKWTMSSIVSIDIDGNKIESCGSTVILYDNYLVKQDCALPNSQVDSSNKENSSINTPSDIQVYDKWNLNWWWKTKDDRNYSIGPKIVMIQSQEGNPICLFSGNKVSWEIPKNLPKTTEITIDGAKLYIHRANFVIIDKTLFD